MKLLDSDDSWGRVFGYETKLTESTLRNMIDTIFPIPEEKQMRFSDCFFGEHSRDFFDSEDYHSW